MSDDATSIRPTLQAAGLALMIGTASTAIAKGPSDHHRSTAGSYSTASSSEADREERADITGSGDTPADLQAILDLEEDELAPGGGPRASSDMKNLRTRSLGDAAYTLALQRAIRHRLEELRKKLEASSGRLDRIFDFRGLLLHEGKVLPPVISSHKGSFKVQDSKTAQSTEHAFRIIKTARIVAEPPSWRDYLLINSPTLETVNPAILPTDGDERAAWEQSAQRGWNDGLREANYMFRTAVNRLRRDFAGMIRFRQLAQQDVVSTPMLAEGRVGIAVDGKALALDQRTFRITRDVNFNEVEQWEPQISSGTR